MAGRIIAWAAALLIVALYAYTVVAAIGNLIGIPGMADAMGLSMTGAGWFWLWFGVVIPIVVLGLALLTGRRRSAGLRVLVLAAGLCLVAAVQLEVMHLVPQASFFA